MNEIVSRSNEDTNDKRWCGRCKQWKDPKEFHKGAMFQWCKPCRKEYYATSPRHERRRLNPDIAKGDHLLSAYNITIDEYNEMFYDQKGLCAACKQPETAMMNGEVKDLSVDHCHETGVVRGLLCSYCNAALGHLFEDPVRIKALLKYVEQRVLPLKQR